MIDDEMGENEAPWTQRRRAHMMRHWMRHAAKVPKGFLRYQLLKKLDEKPMSGSEIMSELENETSGYWKPSPGSIYPLLAWLQDQNLIKEAEQKEAGIRRYTLTDTGKTLLQSETKSREEIKKHMQNLGNTWFPYYRESAGETGRATRRLFRAIKDLHHELRKEHSKEELDEVKKALDEATKQIEGITTKLQN
ncbi:MAG TPA: PadR family transcriptional regulator [Terriglobales bacterium]|nr:PadR family transcriptional regulator [Terriglobales bacterium]